MTPLDALYRCQRAWERTQPQLFFDLWPDGLEAQREPSPPDVGQRVEAALCFESATSEGLPGLIGSRGGLTNGGEPHTDLLRTDGKSRPRSVSAGALIPPEAPSVPTNKNDRVAPHSSPEATGATQIGAF